MWPVLADLQIFATFRWLLAIVCTVYAVLVTLQTLRGWLLYFMSSRYNAILGRYTLALLLRLRVKRFAPELAQIGALIAALAVLLWAHRFVE